MAIVVRLSLLVAQGIYKGLNRDAHILALYSETLVHMQTHFDWCVKKSCDGMIFVSLCDTQCSPPPLPLSSTLLDSASDSLQKTLKSLHR